MAMWSGGFSVASKKFTTGEVNWKSVAVDTGLRAMGAVSYTHLTLPTNREV